MKRCLYLAILIFIVFSLTNLVVNYLNRKSVIHFSITTDWEWTDAKELNECFLTDKYSHSTPLRSSNKHRLAILIPFRNRFNELEQLLPELKLFLKKQHIDHNFYIIHQVDKFRFNRGALLNVGALESFEAEFRGLPFDHYHDSKSNLKNKFTNYCIRPPRTDYLALHDVDLIPVDPNLSYSWPPSFGAVHLVPAWLHPIYNAYKQYAGGILLIRRTHFDLVNGMSNHFWGWGWEDDEFKKRLHRKDLQILVPKNVTMGVRSFRHIHDETLHIRDTRTYYDQEIIQRYKFSTGGLTTLNYSVVNRRVLVIGGVSAILIDVKLKCNSNACYLKQNRSNIYS